MAIFDQINLLLWAKTKDGEKGRNRPKPILSVMDPPKEERRGRTFRTGKEFKEEYERLLKKRKEVK